MNVTANCLETKDWQEYSGREMDEDDLVLALSSCQYPLRICHRDLERGGDDREVTNFLVF